MISSCTMSSDQLAIGSLIFFQTWQNCQDHNDRLDIVVSTPDVSQAAILGGDVEGGCMQARVDGDGEVG